MINTEETQRNVKMLKDYIRQYEEGLITLHEMANATAHRCVHIVERLPDQGCDGLPPNNILPNGERDDGVVFVG